MQDSQRKEYGLKELLLELSGRNDVSFTSEKMSKYVIGDYIKEDLLRTIYQNFTLSRTFWKYLLDGKNFSMKMSLMDLENIKVEPYSKGYLMHTPFMRILNKNMFNEDLLSKEVAERKEKFLERYDKRIKRLTALRDYCAELEEIEENSKFDYKTSLNVLEFNLNTLPKEKKFLERFYDNFLVFSEAIEKEGLLGKMKEEVRDYCNYYPAERLENLKTRLDEVILEKYRESIPVQILDTIHRKNL